MSTRVMLFASLVALVVVAFADGAPALSVLVEDSPWPGDTEVADVSEGKTPQKEPVATSAVASSATELRLEDQATPDLGESVTVGRGRGKRTRIMAAQGKFVLGYSQQAAGGWNRDEVHS